jgi:hypothetical protein
MSAIKLVTIVLKLMLCTMYKYDHTGNVSGNDTTTTIPSIKPNKLIALFFMITSLVLHD